MPTRFEQDSLVSTKSRSNPKHGRIIRSITGEGIKKNSWVVEFMDNDGRKTEEILTSNQLKNRSESSSSGADTGTQLVAPIPRASGRRNQNSIQSDERVGEEEGDNSDDNDEEEFSNLLDDSSDDDDEEEEVSEEEEEREEDQEESSKETSSEEEFRQVSGSRFLDDASSEEDEAELANGMNGDEEDEGTYLAFILITFFL